MRNPRNEGLTDGAPAKAGAQFPSDGEQGTGLLPAQEHEAHTPERTCILTRRTAGREELIRLALGPDGQVHPDVRAKAPGRGAWIGVSRPQLEAALAKGKLRGALSRAFKTGEVAVAPDLPERIERELSRAALERLGMEARAGNLVTGADRVEQAARMGRVHLLLHAADAGEDGRRRLDQAWRVGGAEELGHSRGLVIPADRTILSMALGRENVVHVALTDPAAAKRVSHALTRWRAFIVGDAGLGRGDIAAGNGSADERNEGHS